MRGAIISFTPLDMAAKFFYVYVLKSANDGQFYAGYSANLRQRFAEHLAGRVESTRNHLPVELIYYEACRSQADAIHRERYLKTAWGKRYLKTRLKNYLMG
jgi:putative endonuclease